MPLIINSRQPVVCTAYLLLVVMLTSACQDMPARPLFAESTKAPFIPPTQVITTPSPLPAHIEQETPVPTATPKCETDLMFKEDLTIPDGSQVHPGEKLDKRWLVENSGDCNWDVNYRIRLIAGPSLGAATEQALYPARSNTEAVIRIEFTAPYEQGIYRSAWQAYNPKGESFGHIFYVDFVVTGE
jgi:hypothetical protein